MNDKRVNLTMRLHLGRPSVITNHNESMQTLTNFGKWNMLHANTKAKGANIFGKLNMLHAKTKAKGANIGNNVIL